MTVARETLREKWRRFRQRPPEDRVLILRAALLFPLIRIGLRLFGFLRCKELIEKFSPAARLSQSPSAHAQHESALRAARAVRSAQLHGPAHPNCLERSLALWWLLRRDGVDGELHIGARKQGTRLEAHAWVELRGHVLNDAAEVHQEYARFDAPIAAAEAGSYVSWRAEARAVARANLK